MFSESGEIVTEETCTQNLQTFHQAKHYMGSSLKSKNLSLANQNLNVIFEPREPEYLDAEISENKFRNVWLNHPNITNFPVAQLYKLANTLA